MRLYSGEACQTLNRYASPARCLGLNEDDIRTISRRTESASRIHENGQCDDERKGDFHGQTTGSSGDTRSSRRDAPNSLSRLQRSAST